MSKKNKPLTAGNTSTPKRRAMTHKTSMDKTAKVITILVTILFVGIIIGQYSIITNEGQSGPFYTTTACLLIYFIAFASRPINYVVTKDELIIRRLFLNVRIKRIDIRSVEILDRGKIRGSIWLFGVCGLFGYTGRFANLSLGGMTWYITRRSRPVLVQTTENKRIIISPDDPGKFIADFTN